MAPGIGSIGFGFVAGMLSTLSPCVLPLLPLVLAGAASAHRRGVAALIAGLMLSFVVIGLFVATVGFSLGLTGEVFRTISAVLMLLLGLTLLSGALQQWFAIATAGIGNAGNRLTGRLSISGAGGQLLIGVLLGAIWSPCVGPTLGAASVLAAQGRDLGSVAAIMVAFAIGTAVPLVVVGGLSRTTLRRWQGRIMGASKLGKQALGASVLAVALLILTGTDKSIEAAAVAASPAWLTELTTRF